MPDRTVQQITNAAYLKIGKKKPNDTDDNNALFALQDMLSLWSIEGLVVPFYVTENFTLSTGKGTYSIGVSGDSPDLVTTTGRPIRLTVAFIRISDNDHSIDVNMNKLEYANIISKSTQSKPDRVYYDPQYPNGTLKFNVECDAAYDFHLISEKPLANVSALTDTLNLPLGINQTLVYNLAIMLSIGLNNEIGDDARRIAIESKDSLESRNAIEKLLGEVRLDNAIVGRGSPGRINIFAGH